MEYNLEIRLKAILDIQNATDYYDGISIHLGDRFEDELYDTYKKITTNPQLYKYLSEKQGKNYRCARLKSFPYLVIYKINGNTIVIVSVFNTHRKPKFK